MNRKQLYNKIMSSIETGLNETVLMNGRRPIGFYTDEEREAQNKELAENPQEEQNGMEDNMIKQFQLMALMALVKAAPYKVIVDYISGRLLNDLPNNSIVISIDNKHTAILCETLDDYIAILKIMDGRYDKINCETFAQY